MKTLVLLDANHLMHRAYWAIQRTLSTSSGEQVNTVFGVASMLLSILKREHPDEVVACFDEGSETFRHEEHEEYKAGRAETPDDFYEQIPRVHQCFAAFSIPSVSDPKFEADDLIGTLAVRGSEQGMNVLIVTGDKDLYQMADHNIKVVVPHKGYSEPEYLDSKGVEGKLGVSPEQVPDFKGLTGDSSDNLKGVQGIGPKTAAKLLQQYGTLDALYEHLSEVKGSAKTKLENDKESAFFCRKMARIVTDVPLSEQITKLDTAEASAEALDQFFSELEFHMLRKRFQKFREEDNYMRQHFAGEIAAPDVPAETVEFDRADAEQLPLLD